MKPYQQTGLSFLVQMHQNGMSAILGDEMGLGKTLQTLSLIQWLKETYPPQDRDDIRPCLVVCPLSVLNGWVNEARKWTPGLKVLRFHGPVNERLRLKQEAVGRQDHFGKKTKGFAQRDFTGDLDGAYDLVVTTYETFAAEKSWLQSAYIWRYIILDEGHKIKNDETGISKALQGVKGEYRLMLTGTPLQNNLVEMWALLHWLLPDVFTKTTSQLFKDSFDLGKGKVDTNILDDARRLLELIMLRRMKSSPGVDLGLPPKEEILLFVPLTPVQKLWYTRLLTKAGDAMLEDVFSDVKNKEAEARKNETLEEQGLAKLGDLDADEWGETAGSMRKAIEREPEQKAGKYRQLMNLLMQLRKCCIHPYLLRNAEPDPYTIGPHVVQASSKFIVLEKIIRELLANGKKLLIFSGFTTALNLAEDLLELIGQDADFLFLRLDGSTARARRNLNIRLFNDMHSRYKVMLISTRAGGLGINLTAASHAVFLDEDWNPQTTLQAEARIHRIGQTAPHVTIYKLCTQGTAEEQMMGRIRKKLYLAAKVTETMKIIHGQGSNFPSPVRGGRSSDGGDEMPQLDTSQLLSIIRRGAQTLVHEQIDVTQMLAWDLNTIMEKCKDQPSDPYNDGQASADEEKAWLSSMERVETTVLDGKKYHRQQEVESPIDTPLSREDRRKNKNTTVIMDGHIVSKQSTLCEDWEAVPTLAGKDSSLAEPKRAKKASIVNQDRCQDCHDGGDLICCTRCPRSYHQDCLAQVNMHLSGFSCPQHECCQCQRKTADAGGMVYRCRWCPKGFCEDCLDWDKTTLIGDALPEYEILGFNAVDQAYFIRCPACSDKYEKYSDFKRFVDKQAAKFDDLHVQFLSHLEAKRLADTEHLEDMTDCMTLDTPGLSTPQTPLDMDNTPKKRKVASLEVDDEGTHRHTCEVCRKTFKHGKGLEIHRQMSEFCNLELLQARGIDILTARKMLEKIEQKPTGPIACSECGAQFRTSAGHQAHVQALQRNGVCKLTVSKQKDVKATKAKRDSGPGDGQRGVYVFDGHGGFTLTNTAPSVAKPKVKKSDKEVEVIELD